MLLSVDFRTASMLSIMDVGTLCKKVKEVSAVLSALAMLSTLISSGNRCLGQRICMLTRSILAKLNTRSKSAKFWAAVLSSISPRID
jgi:hypothetical protein